MASKTFTDEEFLGNFLPELAELLKKLTTKLPFLPHFSNLPWELRPKNYFRLIPILGQIDREIPT